MNFLQLCQRAAGECGVSGTISAVTGNVGNLGRIVNWVGDAWNDIQSKYDDWTWMRSTNIYGQGVAFQTIAGQATYPLGTVAGTVGVAATAFGKWDRESFRNYTTAAGVSNEMFMDWVPFDAWRNNYMLGAMRAVQTRPVVFTIGPDQSISLGSPPNALYTVTGDFFVAPSIMVADVDVPLGLPVKFHMLIVYKAMKKYAYYESASEVETAADVEYIPMMSKLEAVRAQEVTFGGPLA